MAMNVDLLIIGGGPTGLYAAIAATLRGMRVGVFEPKEGAIDKACGEGLMPPAVAALERVGVQVAEHFPFEGIRYIGRNTTAEARFQQGVGRGVRRLALHHALRERALALGVDIVPEKVKQFTMYPTHVEIGGHTAPVAFASDGLHSSIRKQLGLQLPSTQPSRYGLRQHFRVRPWSPFVEVHWCEDAEAYITPVSADTVGLAFLFDDRLRDGSDIPPFERLLTRFPAVRDRLQGAVPASTLRGAGPFEQNVSRPLSGRILLIGDAAGYVDPITGEGLRLGFDTADAAISRVLSRELESYNSDWWRITRRYRWLTRGLLAIRRSPVRPWIVPAMSRLPWAFSKIVNTLAHGSAPLAVRSTLHGKFTPSP